MTGIWAILVYVGGVVVLGFLAFAALDRWRRESRLGTLLLAVGLALPFLMMCNRGFQYCVFLYQLHHLGNQNVDNIEISSYATIRASNYATILTALNDAQWFEPSHSGWSRPVSLKIRLKNGRRYDYSIALYKSGAVILGGNKNAFSESLPSALQKIGIILPSETHW